MIDEDDPRVILARERTALANERTLWAYVRTGIELLILIIILSHLGLVNGVGPAAAIYGIDAVLFVLAVAVVSRGVVLYVGRRRRLRSGELGRAGNGEGADLL